jgi:O-antigen/teichoic acid export membrane protein
VQVDPPGGREAEDPIHRLDRQWSELLQEIRVTQTGVQLLTGFLLTLPFQQRFTALGDAQQDIYLADVVLALAAITLLVAPVLIHRLLFRRHQRARTIGWAHRCALAGAACFGTALVGVATLTFDMVAGTTAAAITGCLVALAVTGLWLLAPWHVHRRTREDPGVPGAPDRPSTDGAAGRIPPPTPSVGR